MRFVAICKKCENTYINSTIRKCGNCKIELTDIQFSNLEIDEKSQMIKIYYRILGEK